jgi:hypothetical protein
MTNSSGFAADSEVLTLIHEGAHALWDLVIAGYGPEYFQKYTTFATSSGREYYNLPSDFYRLLGVSINRTADATLTTRTGWQKMRRASHHEVPELLNGQGSDPYATRYQLGKQPRGQTSSVWQLDRLILYPVPAGVWTVLVTYVPTLKGVSEDLNDENSAGLGTYTYDGIHGWEEYIVLWASIRLLGQEESSTSDMKEQMAEIRDRIAGLAANRDHVEPEYVSDVRSLTDWAAFPAARRELP